MIEYEFSEHAHEMLKERNIKREWVDEAIDDPNNKESEDDGTVHYLKTIEGFGGRVLRVVVNPDIKPFKIVTLFFDRRLRRDK